MRIRLFLPLLTLLACSLHAAVEQELKDATGKTILKYVVEVPENLAPAGTKDPAKQVGLILCSAEHDRPTGDEILPVWEALQRLGLSDQYILLAGHPQGQKWNAADDEPLSQLLAWAKKTYPVNPRRVYMYGKGEGGKISGEFSMLHPDLVTAGISYSWGMWRMPVELNQALDFEKSAPEFYIVLGLRDLSYHLTTVRDAYQRMNAKGYHVIYREFADLGARTYHPPSNVDALEWATKLRNKTLPLSPEEKALLLKPVVNAAGYFGNLALVGGAVAGQAVQKLLDSPDANVRAAAAETCSHAIFSEATMDALAKKVTDASPKVRRAVFRALAANANWRSAAAQKALVEVALHGASDDDRIAAVDGIAYAVRYQMQGARQDAALFATLVTLLTDKNEEIRTMTANLLAPVKDAGYRGDLGRPEQKTPPGGWPKWVETMTAKAEDYRYGYRACGKDTGEAVELYCKGGELVAKDPAQAFAATLKAAELGYVPAQAMVAMMYAVSKGTQQNYPEAVKWWTKAAEAGNVLAAQSLSMAYRGVAGVKGDPELSAKWGKFASEHSQEE